MPGFIAGFIPSFMPGFIAGFMPSFMPGFIAGFMPSFMLDFIPGWLLCAIPPLPQLGALAISAALERAGCPKEAVDEVYMGAVLQVTTALHSIKG